MSVRSRLRSAGRTGTGSRLRAAPDRQPEPPGGRDPDPDVGSPVFLVQRAGALVVGAFLLVFGVLGFAGGLDFFSTQGERVLGLSSNGLLSALSIVVGLVLLAVDARGPRPASTLMIVIGALFLTSALVNLALLRTPFNVLAFEMRNVLFSIGVGLVLLVLGAYGRVSGNLPADSPYASPGQPEEAPESYPSTPEEFAAEDAMREAELAVSEHRATDDQRRRVRAMAAVHTRGDRRRVWLQFDPPPTAPAPAPAAPDRWAERAAAALRRRRQGQGQPSGK
jgi:hypothetical protein